MKNFQLSGNIIEFMEKKLYLLPLLVFE